MDKFIHISAYVANIILILITFILISETYGSDTYLAMLLLIPPCLSLWALYNGPDHHERRLQKELNKARMEKELSELKKQKN
jgi:hypothetical protein